MKEWRLTRSWTGKTRKASHEFTLVQGPEVAEHEEVIVVEKSRYVNLLNDMKELNAVHEELQATHDALTFKLKMHLKENKTFILAEINKLSEDI